MDVERSVCGFPVSIAAWPNGGGNRGVRDFSGRDLFSRVEILCGCYRDDVSNAVSGVDDSRTELSTDELPVGF